MRHPPLDRDSIVSQAIVYGTLGVVITGLYVAVVGGLGQLIGGDDPNTALAITATAVVAVGFQPLRWRLQRLVDGIVHGRRATPHEVLSEFSRRVAADDDTLLGLAAQSLVEGTAADRVGVWMSIDDELVETTVWPTEVGAGGAGSDDHDVTSLPISHDGTELGALTLSVPRAQQLSEQDVLLAHRVASGMGLALGNRVRTESLQARVDELRQSRRRLVAVLDDTRRDLERDLHDGAQQQLVALKVKLGLAQSIAQGDGANETAAQLRAMTDAADVTVDAMRNFARGLYPPLLEAEGLGPAITAGARRAPIPVTVAIDGLDRYDRQIETTINLCVIEALENVARHAQASTTHVSIAHENGAIAFRVRDDGVGFDAASTPPGAGITYMADRIDAAAGTLSITSTPGKGTTVSGTVPVGEVVP